MSHLLPSSSARRGTLLRRLLLSGLLVALALAAPALGPPTLASPQQNEVVVRVTIERVRALDCMDGPGEPGDWLCDEADFYAQVNLHDVEQRTPSVESDDTRPNWEVSARLPLDLGSIPLTLAIYDADGGLRGDDDHADILDGPGRDLQLTLDLATCAISGHLTGACETQLTSSGDDGGDEEVQVWFRVEVVRPPSALDLRLRCTHDPLWPQPGQTVTFTVDAMDAGLAPRVVQDLEVWIGGGAAAAHTCNAANNCSHTAGPFVGSLEYACLVRDAGREVWSDWRSVAVGTAGVGTAVPVLFTGPRTSRIDVVLLADRDNYTSAQDPAFLADALDVVEGAYYAEDLYLVNQDKINFWIGQDMADAGGFAGGSCDLWLPGSWNGDFTFADVGAVLHTDNLRDCALFDQHAFSSEPTHLRTVLHESGHQPFGLADEYCCDGGYFDNWPFPNLYEDDFDDCETELPRLRAWDQRLGQALTPARSCRSFEAHDDFWSGDETWWLSDPSPDHLMDDNGIFRAADARRISWVLDLCASARCDRVTWDPTDW